MTADRYADLRDDDRDDYKPRQPIKSPQQFHKIDPSEAAYRDPGVYPVDVAKSHLSAARVVLGPVTTRRHFDGSLDDAASRAKAREMTAEYRSQYQQFACPWPLRHGCEQCPKGNEESESA